MRKVLAIVYLIFPIALAAQVTAPDTTRPFSKISGTGFVWNQGKFEQSFTVPKDTFKLKRSDSGSLAYKGGLQVWNGAKWDKVGASAKAIGASGTGITTSFSPSDSAGVGYQAFTVNLGSGTKLTYKYNRAYLSGTTSANPLNSNLYLDKYGSIMAERYRQSLIFRIDSAMTLDIGVGTKEGQYIANGNMAYNQLYTNFNSSSYIKQNYIIGDGTSYVSKTKAIIDPAVGDYIQLTADVTGDSVTVTYNNLTSGHIYSVTRTVNYTTPDGINIHGYPAIIFRSGKVELISYTHTVADYKPYVFLGNSITEGYFTSKPKDWVSQLAPFGQPIDNMAKLSNSIYDYRFGVKYELELLKNRVVFLSGIQGNDPFKGINIDSSKVWYQWLVAKLKAQGCQVVHITSTARTTVLGSGSMSDITARNSWIKATYLSIDSVVDAEPITAANISRYTADGCHLSAIGADTMALVVRKTIPMFFPVNNPVSSGGGGTVTASNGLTKTGNDIKLGGDLTETLTTVGTGSNKLILLPRTLWALGDTVLFGNGVHYVDADPSHVALISGAGFVELKTDSILLKSGNIKIDLASKGAGKVLTSDANGMATWQTRFDGITALSAIGTAPNANGATITGSTLNLQPASASFGGVVTTGPQFFSGTKTFTSGISAGSSLYGTGVPPFALLYDGGAGGSYGWFLNSLEMQHYVPDGAHYAWNGGGQQNASTVNEWMRLEGGSLIIGGTSINASAKLQLNSTTQGFLPPRMTTTEINAISSPANGLLVYNTTLNKLCVYENGTWKQVTTTNM